MSLFQHQRRNLVRCVFGIFREESEGNRHLCFKFLFVFNQSNINHCVFLIESVLQKGSLGIHFFFLCCGHILLQPGLTPAPRMRVVVCVRGGGGEGMPAGRDQ